jgi:hypothetical protein
MSYYNGTITVVDDYDYAIWGKTHAQNGTPTQVSSIPAPNQAAYTAGFTLGTYWKNNLSREKF